MEQAIWEGGGQVVSLADRNREIFTGLPRDPELFQFPGRSGDQPRLLSSQGKPGRIPQPLW